MIAARRSESLWGPRPYPPHGSGQGLFLLFRDWLPRCTAMIKTLCLNSPPRFWHLGAYSSVSHFLHFVSPPDSTHPNRPPPVSGFILFSIHVCFHTLTFSVFFPSCSCIAHSPPLTHPVCNPQKVSVCLTQMCWLLYYLSISSPGDAALLKAQLTPTASLH